MAYISEEGFLSSYTFGALLDANRVMTRGRFVLWKLDLTTRRDDEVTLLCKLRRRLIVRDVEGAQATKETK